MSNSNLVTITDAQDAQMITGPGVLKTVILTAKTTKTNIKLYDGTSASGVLLVNLKAIADDSNQLHDLSISFQTGIYADVDSNTDYLGVEAIWGQTFSAGGGQAGQ